MARSPYCRASAIWEEGGEGDDVTTRRDTVHVWVTRVILVGGLMAAKAAAVVNSRRR